MPNEFGPDRLGVSRAVLKKEAVNRRVAGSSPARGAKFRTTYRDQRPPRKGQHRETPREISRVENGALRSRRVAVHFLWGPEQGCCAQTFHVALSVPSWCIAFGDRPVDSRLPIHAPPSTVKSR